MTTQTSSNGHGNGQGPSASAKEDAPRAAEAGAGGNEFRQRLDQMGTILAKGLDLAEAGVSLGVTIISRVGVAAQQKIREGLDVAAGQNPPATDPRPDQPQAEPEYGLTNRLPLTPGGTGRISFSVNNDSLIEPKKVELRIEGFAADSQGAHFDPSQFSVKPAQKTIAPADFEKFVLQGTVPADIQPGIYRGAVLVDSGTAFRIPVVLVVTPL